MHSIVLLWEANTLSVSDPFAVAMAVQNWTIFAGEVLGIVAFGMLIPLSSNRQIRNGVIVLVSMIGISALLSLIQSFIGLDNKVFNICSIASSAYLYPLTVIYAWSIVIRNNDWKRSEKSWTGMIVLLSCISILMSLPDFWEMNICVPGSNSHYAELGGGGTDGIIFYVWFVLDMIVCIKLAFSSAFTENLRESPLEKRQYFPFNKYVLAGVIALVIRFAANAALAYYVSTL